MNAIEIEQAVSELFSQPYDATEFPYQFLEAFGNPKTTLKRLRASESNKSDCGGVLQRNHIHILTCAPGETTTALATLQQSATNAKNKVNYLLVTDGEQINATDLQSGEPLVCDYADFPNHFGFFLGLANIRTVKAIRDSAFDIRATAKLNRLYVQLLKDNPDWAKAERRHDMNHFMARLIFCFFAEDTDIFNGDNLFSATIEQMSAADGGDLEHVIGEIFRAMNTKIENRGTANLRPWADAFPYVNGGLFSDAPAVPRFNKTTRAYLLQIGLLDWTKINPDIFGSMIQAVADEEERGELGMHYTSVPNILKVLNPLFLDALRAKLADAGGNKIKLLNLRKRLARIRVFDPACGSGNFLVIAYREMRQIENQINEQRGEKGRKSDIPITNFRGIELRDFSAEIARLALIIAEYQANVKYLGQLQALQAFLPLSSQNWITCGNALRLDWLAVCPPASKTFQILSDDLLTAPAETDGIEFANAGGETYICGNPPFSGTRKQTEEQKKEITDLFSPFTSHAGSIDYVGAWLLKAAEYNKYCAAPFAFVATNSICQGRHVSILWKMLMDWGLSIRFAHTSFKWKNLASKNAGVTVVVVGVDNIDGGTRTIFNQDEQFSVSYINPYLTSHDIDFVGEAAYPIFTDTEMNLGVYYSKSKGLILPSKDLSIQNSNIPDKYIKKFIGSDEFINGKLRYCLWISDENKDDALSYPEIAHRVSLVKDERLKTKDKSVNKLAKKPYQFREFRGEDKNKIFIPIVSTENREYLPVGMADETMIPSNKLFYIPNAELWALALIASRLHWVWIGTVCVRMRTDFSYSNTLGWNTFPVPRLTTQNKLDLTRCAEDILLTREAHFPATIADLYAPEAMPENLRQAHERNDETIERIYIGRRFKNDTERLEKLFALYTKMRAAQPAEKPKRKKKST